MEPTDSTAHPGGRRVGLAGAWLGALALVLACGGRGDGPSGELRAHVERVQGARSLGLDPAQVAEVVARELSASPLLEVDAADRAAGAPVDVRVAAGPEATLRLQVSLPAPADLGPRAPDGGLSAAVELEADDGQIDPRADLPLAARRAAAVLEARLLLARGRREDVGRVLMADDPGLLTLALEWVLRNDPRGWADACLPLVRHPDPGVAALAVTVVGRGGDRSLVPALIDAAAAAAAPAVTHALYEALGRLGGPKAAAFLAMAAQNEDDPSLARAAEAALAQARRAPLAEVALPGARGKIRRGHR